MPSGDLLAGARGTYPPQGSKGRQDSSTNASWRLRCVTRSRTARRRVTFTAVIVPGQAPALLALAYCGRQLRLEARGWSPCCGRGFRDQGGLPALRQRPPTRKHVNPPHDVATVPVVLLSPPACGGVCVSDNWWAREAGGPEVAAARGLNGTWLRAGELHRSPARSRVMIVAIIFH